MVRIFRSRRGIYNGDEWQRWWEVIKGLKEQERWEKQDPFLGFGHKKWGKSEKF